MRILKAATRIIEQHAKEAGQTPKEFSEACLIDMFGNSQLVDILKVGGGCPIEAYGALLTEGVENRKIDNRDA